MCRSFLCAFIASAQVAASVGPVSGQLLCRPTLTITDVHFSDMIPPTLTRKWSAIVTVDASRCTVKSSGAFDIVFMRLKETAPDAEFREEFTWQPPAVNVAVNFAFDEAVQGYRIANVTACDCGHNGK